MDNFDQSSGLFSLSLSTSGTAFQCLLFCSSFSCLCRSGTEFILSHDRLLFVIHAQIEKCSQVIRGDRRTGSRAAFFCVCPHWKSACVIFPHLVSCHVSCRAGFSTGVVFLIAGYHTDARLVNSAKNKFVSAHVEPCEIIPLFGPRTTEQCKVAWFPHATAVRRSWLDLSAYLNSTKFVFHFSAHVSRAKIVSGALCTC